MKFILCFYSCNESQTQYFDDSKDSIKVPYPSNTNNSNIEFRAHVLPKLTNKKDIEILDTLMIKLDKQGLSFCQFVKRLFDIDDSCYEEAKKEFPDPSMQVEFGEYHNKILKLVQPKYLKSIDLNNHWADIAITAYAFNSAIKNFCGEY